MSISSEASIYVEYPATNDVELDFGECMVTFDRVENGTRELEVVLYDRYTDGLLDPVIKAFGKPLEEVEGLVIDLRFETCAEGYFRCNLTLADGRWEYLESEVFMVKTSMDKCPIAVKE